MPVALLLLGAGAKVNAQDTNLDTPLSVAIACRQDDVAIALLDAGGDPSREAKDGSTVLFSAAKGTHVMLHAYLPASLPPCLLCLLGRLLPVWC